MTSIQANCQFYNWSIQNEKLKVQTGEQMSLFEQMMNVFKIESVGNLNAGNVTIHGNQIGDNSNL
ncbi:MAG: hypothetical protein DCF22_16925 [Leptolyngbya sp.]|nr:MAG: hypothetical protein DCF22_16925 [Leptolyngbya sp.]